MSRARFAILALVLLHGLVAVAPAGAKVIEVPKDYSSVESALEMAVKGDEIRIAPGVYDESLALRGGITLVGTGATPEETVLNGGYLRKILSLVGDSEPVLIENITLQDGFAGFGAGITVDGGDLTLDRVHLVGNTAAGEGGAMLARNSRLTLRNCLFYANYALGGGGGALHIEGSDLAGSTQVIEQCTFAGNSGCCGGTSLTMAGCDLDISNNILEDVRCLPGANPTFTCNNGSVCGVDGGFNFIADPLFCGFEYVDCRLEPTSPCLAENSPDCGQIGAFGGCAVTATGSTSISALKALYR